MEPAVMSPEDLRKMQLIQLDMLKEFDRVCRKNDIKYILDAGTLLGAVRYGGFIPWDDDIDVRMLRKDYEKFLSVSNELKESIFIQDYRTDKEYPWYYGKLRKKGTTAIRVGQEKLKMINGVFLDIFVSDGIPSNKLYKLFRNIFGFFARKILYSRMAKDSARFLIQRLWWKFISFIPKDVAYKIMEFYSRKFDDKNCTRFGCIGWHSKNENDGYYGEWLKELQEIEFEGEKFFAPKDLHSFLVYSFGEDYMIPPPAEMRNGTSPLSSYYLGD
jgi:lipopolysaccharide cholinephosphotransferase